MTAAEEQQPTVPDMGDTLKNVRVCVRCRPFIAQEKKKGHSGDLLRVEPSQAQITIRTSSDPSADRQTEKRFAYDRVFDQETTQEQVFEQSGAKGMVQQVVDGFHATVFAYGQTSSGKTHTMEGYQYTATGADGAPRINFDVDDERVGLMPRAIRELFEGVQRRKTGGAGSTAGAPASEQLESVRVRCSYVQIYMEKIYDLLAPGGARVERGGDAGGPRGWGDQKGSRQRRVRWDTRRGFFVENLEWVECTDANQCLEALQGGVRNKIMATHQQNEASSRSHCIFQLEIEQTKETGSETTGVHVSGASQRVLSTLSLVDLAGSERQKSTGARGAAMKESIEINTSLFVLRKVIQALAAESDPGARQHGRRGGSSSKHIPFRDSKLTSLLKHSLGGNSHTLMLACCSPSDAYVDENASTLEYASTAKRIANRPVMNEDANTKLIRKLKEQIISLKEQLAQAHMVGGLGNRGAGGAGNSGSGSVSARGPPNSGRRSNPSPNTMGMGGNAAGADRPSTSSHPFDTDYGRHLGEKVVESVSLLKRMVATNTQLRATSIEAAESASAAERSNANLMEENQQLRDRLEQMQELLVRSNSAGEGGGDNSAAAEAERLMNQLSSRSWDTAGATAGGGAAAAQRTTGVAGSNPSWLPSQQQQQPLPPQQPPLAQQQPALEQQARADGMDPMLAAALYGPLPGTAGTAAGSQQSMPMPGGPARTAASLTADIGQEATSLKAENDAMEQRLAALTQSIDGMSGGVLSSNASVRSSRENKQITAGTRNRNSTALWEGPTVEGRFKSAGGAGGPGAGGAPRSAGAGRRAGAPGSSGGYGGGGGGGTASNILMPTSMGNLNHGGGGGGGGGYGAGTSSAELDALNGLLDQREALSQTKPQQRR